MSDNFIYILYLISAICFIMSLKGLSSPKSARLGNLYGISGMILAIFASFYYVDNSAIIYILVALAFGGIIGAAIALRIQMTMMPQLVAGFHSLVGAVAAMTGYVALLSPEAYNISLAGEIPTLNLIEMSLGSVIGALTFSGSIVAFAKLQGLVSAKPLNHKILPLLNILLLLGLIISLIYFVNHQDIVSFSSATLIATLLGVMIIMPVGGADMPVIVSMLNSYSGWAAAGIGFTLASPLLIITGALIGASGAILSYVMCSAMNRSIFNVIFGSFFTSMANSSKITDAEEKFVKTSNAEEAAHFLLNANSVIIVPGYGMAVSQAQHAIKEIVQLLQKHNIQVRFAIHPVAGRMPGHMNVLLAEANISYESVFELEEINRDFSQTDVVLVIGANDVTNPAAKNDPSSPIYGMPILDVENARTVFFIKRSMASGYAGIENQLFYKDNNMMLFGDAKKVVEEILKFMQGNSH